MSLLDLICRLQSCFLVALVLLSPANACADDAGKALESNFTNVIEQGEQSIVSVARLVATPAQGIPAPLGQQDRRGLVGPDQPDFVPTDFGTGVIITPPKERQRPGVAYVLTNAHVVLGSRRSGDWIPFEDARRVSARIAVRLHSRHLLPATLVAADPRSDLAVLQLDLKGEQIPDELAPPIKMGDASTMKKGSLVVALGNPYAIARDGSASASVGIISNISRRPEPVGGRLQDLTDSDVTLHHYGTLLHVDMRLNVGASGGGLLNLDGELVGLTTALAALEGYEKSAGYAIPMTPSIRRIVDSLCQGYEVEYGFLGIRPGIAPSELIRPFRAITLQPTAARALRIARHSPAEAAGMREGDILLAVNDQPVYDDVDLVREVGLLGPGAIAKVRLIRPAQSKEITLDVALGKWPVYDDALIFATRQRHEPWRGLTYDYATARRKYLAANTLDEMQRGVVITKVEPGSAAANAGLVEGMYITEVDGVKVDSPKQFAESVRDHRDAIKLQLTDQETVTVKP